VKPSLRHAAQGIQGQGFAVAFGYGKIILTLNLTGLLRQ